LVICQNISFSDGVNSNDSISKDRTTSAAKKKNKPKSQQVTKSTIKKKKRHTHFYLSKLEPADIFSESKYAEEACKTIILTYMPYHHQGKSF
jgi:hypothetical protein